jgi:hypothetical protein
MTYFITIAGRRWPTEETFKTGKNMLGWDQSQARTWDGAGRHTALSALAGAIRGALPAGHDEDHAGSTSADDSDVPDADLQIPLGHRPVAPLQHPAPRHRNRVTSRSREEVTECNTTSHPGHHAERQRAHTPKTATVVRGCAPLSLEFLPRTVPN